MINISSGELNGERLFEDKQENIDEATDGFVINIKGI